ncbi:tRNA pseudouridine synthase, mitochondrial-like [Raphidocelis subcapitata]|uniref:tRNA pseudouridine synthase, mitochondrial-like n=1 Tax=Raphidocelis subcapitata TaxID=307507 RepID=A0A2V0P2S3_9CHLO|nr:tRNA pseudouridine synthase, mitochondrial-like [Raphidocelis subcapitata]|eukprot:GBF91497.1 tRNA pseudouridine synthase, mitochondrial-like [Raphidocelis subcapitata]
MQQHVDQEQQVEGAQRGEGKQRGEGEQQGEHRGEETEVQQQMEAMEDAEGAEEQAEGGEGGTEKRRRRKYAVWVAYVGAGYHGMQRNPGCATIEEELERALVRADAIPEELAGSFIGIKWSRCARTDKGVSAVSQVVSAKICGDPLEAFAGRVNAHLPDQIRVLGISRATEGFSARLFCDKRRYEYVLPVWMFDKNMGKGRTAADVESARQQLQREAGGSGGGGGGGGGGGRQQAASNGDDEKRHQRRMRSEVASSSYDFSAEEQQRLNALLRQYCGTHNFHNYTVKVDPYSNEALRYILSFDCAGTVQLGGRTWARLVVVGQSFMLHQIRKMVGMVVAIMRGAAPPGCLAAALDPDRDFNVPMAPELGLFLAEAYFDGYNRRFGGVHGALTLDNFRDAANAFQQRVYRHMAVRDDDEMVNAAWIRTLHNDPNFRFSTWDATPKVRHVKSVKRAESVAAQRHGGGGGGGGEAKRQLEAAPSGAAAVTEEEREAKRAALAVPAAAIAAQRAAAAVSEAPLADVDELDALY